MNIKHNLESLVIHKIWLHPIDIYNKAYHSVPKDSGIIKHVVDAFINY